MATTIGQLNVVLSLVSRPLTSGLKAAQSALRDFGASINAGNRRMRSLGLGSVNTALKLGGLAVLMSRVGSSARQLSSDIDRAVKSAQSLADLRTDVALSVFKSIPVIGDAAQFGEAIGQAARDLYNSRQLFEQEQSAQRHALAGAAQLANERALRGSLGSVESITDQLRLATAVTPLQRINEEFSQSSRRLDELAEASRAVAGDKSNAGLAAQLDERVRRARELLELERKIAIERERGARSGFVTRGLRPVYDVVQFAPPSAFGF